MEIKLPQSRQEKQFIDLCRTLLKITADLQEVQQNDLLEYAMKLHSERHDLKHIKWNER